MRSGKKDLLNSERADAWKRLPAYNLFEGQVFKRFEKGLPDQMHAWSSDTAYLQKKRGSKEMGNRKIGKLFSQGKEMKPNLWFVSYFS